MPGALAAGLAGRTRYRRGFRVPGLSRSEDRQPYAGYASLAEILWDGTPAYAESFGNPAGEPQQRRVQLGLNDGSVVEVVSGLAEGESVLEFIPGAPAQMPTGEQFRYRVREISIRRSFGATSSRIFLGVMMETVVATAVAGIVGVMVSVAVVKNPWIQSQIAPGLDEYPAFPLEAPMLGLGSAVPVGALAGAIPALVAVRIKVIDAIRF